MSIFFWPSTFQFNYRFMQMVYYLPTYLLALAASVKVSTNLLSIRFAPLVASLSSIDTSSALFCLASAVE